MDAGVNAEWDRLRTVVLHRPGIEMFLGLLEPYTSLYERAFSRYRARIEHSRLADTLHDEFGVKVRYLKEEILAAADNRPEIRMNLVNAAREAISFSGGEKEIRLAWRDFEKNKDILDAGHFFNILLLNPVIDLHSRQGARDIQLQVTERQPLSNLFYMRDQQVVAKKGVVLSRMAKPQRQREPLLTEFFWKTTGTPVISRVSEPGTFEGGDFFPMKDFALIGTGDRTNDSGALQVMHGLGFDEIGVVSQPSHPLIPGSRPDPMINMHLDTYFNVASPGVVAGPVVLMKEAVVQVFFREGSDFIPAPEKTDLFTFIKEKGFSIIDITTLEQMAYAPNFLCIRDGVILAVEVDRVVRDVLKALKAKAELDPGRYGALLSQAERDYRDLKSEGQFFPHKKEIYQHGIDAYPLILENLTGGYGAARCMSCPMKRG
jgi:arginine deiminase